MGAVSDLMLRNLRDRLVPLIRRTAEDVVLDVIDRKGIPSRTEFRQTMADVEEKARVVASAKQEIGALAAEVSETESKS